MRKKLIVGLGNPGEEYDKTRHNIGFEVIERLSKRWGVSLVKEKIFPAYFGKKSSEEEEILLMMPLTYMNASGSAIKRCIDYYKIPVKGILVIADDMELPLQTLRLRPKGRSGGHNGLKSVEERLGTTEYSRLKIGIGYPLERDVIDHVLGKFSSLEVSKLEQVIETAQEMVLEWLQNPQASFTKELKSSGETSEQK